MSCCQVTLVDEIVSGFVEFELEFLASANGGKEVVELIQAVNNMVYVSQPHLKCERLVTVG